MWNMQACSGEKMIERLEKSSPFHNSFERTRNFVPPLLQLLNDGERAPPKICPVNDGYPSTLSS